MHFKKIIDNLYVLYGAISSNSYLLLGKENILIDPGVHDRSYLIESLNLLNLKTSDIHVILLTHAHADHFVNCKLFPNAKIYASKNAIDLFHKKDFIVTVSLWIKNNYFPENIILLKEPQLINNGNFKLKVFEAFGHTSNDVVFYEQEKKLLFSGDVVFENSFGRVDLFDSSKERMLFSLNKLKELDYEVLLPGHGKVYKVSIKQQKENVANQIKYLSNI